MSRVAQSTDRELSGARETLRVVAPDPIPPAIEGGRPAILPFPQNKALLEERLWLASGIFEEPSYVYFGGVDGSFMGVRRESSNLFMYSLREGEGKNYVYNVHGPGGTPTLIATQNYEPRNRPWYKRTLELNKEVWSPVFSDFRLKFLGISLSKPVYADDNRLLGVATSSIGLKRLSELLQGMSLSEHGVVFIVERSGELVASSFQEPLYKVDGSNVLRLNASDSGSAAIRKAYANMRDYLDKNDLEPGKLLIKPLRDNGPKAELALRLHRDPAGIDWYEVGVVNRADFLGSVTGGVYQTLLLGLASVFITFALGFAILRWVLRDIRKLTLAAKSIGNGEPFPVLNIDRRDEIGQLAQSFQEMERNLRTDRLTNVLNRDSFIAQVDFRRRSSTDPASVHFALLFIDLDRFKAINDQFGHDEGDKVLAFAAMQLESALRKEDSVARFGGDEFVIYLHGVSELCAAKAIADKIRHALNEPITGRDDQQYQIDASVGIALYPQDGLDIETLLRVADERMFEQKRMHRILSYESANGG